MKIVVKYAHDRLFEAEVEEFEPRISGRGESLASAVGNMIARNQQFFGISGIDYTPPDWLFKN